MREGVRARTEWLTDSDKVEAVVAGHVPGPGAGVARGVLAGRTDDDVLLGRTERSEAAVTHFVVVCVSCLSKLFLEAHSALGAVLVGELAAVHEGFVVREWGRTHRVLEKERKSETDEKK